MEDRVTITEGHDRLTLQYHEGDSRALIWSFERGRDWHCRAVITQADFQHGSDARRWISELHSFDPGAGRAMIKVGEEVPVDVGHTRCIYTWREWDLLANREVRLLRVCEDPFEEYDPTRPVEDEHDSVVVIDCKDEHWDDTLYTSLSNRRAIELRNLRSAYESYMEQLAEIHLMEFVGHFSENRGEFKRRFARRD